MKEFSSFAQFAAHLLTITAVQKVEMHRGLEDATAIVTKAAKEKIGHYQGQHRWFNAWDELAESTKDDRESKGFTPNDPLLRTGDLRDSYKGEVSNGEAVVGSESDIAYWLEAGTEHIPPRPVVGPAAMENETKAVEAILMRVAAAWAGLATLPLGIGHEPTEES